MAIAFFYKINVTAFHDIHIREYVEGDWTDSRDDYELKAKERVGFLNQNAGEDDKAFEERVKESLHRYLVKNFGPDYDDFHSWGHRNSRDYGYEILEDFSIYFIEPAR